MARRRLRRPTAQLTPEECRVLEAVAADGQYSLMEWKDVAYFLGKSEGTVTKLASRAYRKLGVNEKSAAVRRHQRMRGHVCAFLRPGVECQMEKTHGR